MLSLVILCTHDGTAQQRFSFTRSKMGSPFTIIFYESDSVRAQATAASAFKLVDSFVHIFSDYIDSSELNRLCARAGTGGATMSVSGALLVILLHSKNAWRESSGTFDITLGPLTRLWRKARKENIFPPDSLVKYKRSLTGFNQVKIRADKKTVSLLKPGMQLDLGGIAQGYIAGKIIDHLVKKGVTSALVDVSGDIMAIGAPPKKEGWTVGINVPGDENRLFPTNVLVRDMAVTTSGDLYQYIEYNGKRYSHIVDPRTGYGITSQRNVTIIARDPTHADWLTKACSILPVAEAKKLAKKFNAELLIVENHEGKLKWYQTPAFSRYWKN